MTGTVSEPFSDRRLHQAAIAAIAVSLVIGAVLGVLHRTLGGPGDQLSYYAQASHLLPFKDHFYGPGYFVALKLLHGITGLSWFDAGKFLSWCSGIGILVLSYRLLFSILPSRYASAAVILMALNPTVISMWYSSLTIAFGALVLLAALTVLAEAESGPVTLLAGLLLGLAALTRFQTSGFALGAVIGILLVRGEPLRQRLGRAGLLTLGVATPLVAWSLFLRVVQGGAPANYNFVHLTIALGQFKQFSETDALINQYHSFLGLLATPGAPFAIGKMMLVEAVKFPFRSGVALLFLASAWLIPGACLLVAQPKSWRPWVVALAVGFFFTNLGAREWVYYYLPLMPLLAFLITSAAATFDRTAPIPARWIQWLVVMGGVLLLGPFETVTLFRQVEWPEWGETRRILSASLSDRDLVSTTAGSLPYGTGMRYVQLSTIYRENRLDRLVPALRSAGVTKLVITERHSLDEHTELEALLRPDTTAIPLGLHRDTLIRRPRRVAILTVTPP